MDDHGRPGDGDWLTLSAAAARSGYSRDALRQRVRRGSLKSSKGNDGQLRVQLRDLMDLPPVDLSPDDHERTGDASLAASLNVPRSSLDVLQSTLNDLRTDLDRTRSSLDASLAAHLVDRGGAERAEAEVAAAAKRIVALETFEAKARALAEQRAVELAILAERAGRAEGEADGLKTSAEHMHAELAQMRREVAEAHNRAVVAEQQVIEATERREGAEVALAKARGWNFLNFLFGREGKGRKP